MDKGKISDIEMKALLQIAQSKGQTLDELLTSLGYQEPAAPVAATADESEPVVTFSAAATPAIPATPMAAMAAPPPPPAEPDEPEPEETTGSNTTGHRCVHCNWDQSIPDTAQPTHNDKLAFLQSVLGQTIFEQEAPLFGNAIKVRFRTLNIREIDLIYAHVYQLQKDGQVATVEDYYETINRIRVYLQLVSIVGSNSLIHQQFPRGINAQTSPGVTDLWSDKLKVTETDQILGAIETFVIEQVLKTESLQRAITKACARFNILVAKLEACADDPDFWNETEQQR
jgi:hypothetical protein